MITAKAIAKTLISKLSQCSCKQTESTGFIRIKASIHFKGYISSIDIVIPKKDIYNITVWCDDNCIMPEIEPMIRQMLARG